MVGWVARSETRREPLADCYIISQSAFEQMLWGLGYSKARRPEYRERTFPGMNLWYSPKTPVTQS